VAAAQPPSVIGVRAADGSGTAVAAQPGSAQPGVAQPSAAPRDLPDFQLLEARMKFFAAEQQSRNAVKGFWERLVGAVERKELPPAFGSAIENGRVDFKGPEGGTWAARAANFRKLVEPFDIASYYRLALDGNRPTIYCRLEIAAKEYHRDSGDKAWKRGVGWAQEALRNDPPAGAVTAVRASTDPLVNERLHPAATASPAKTADDLDV